MGVQGLRGDRQGHQPLPARTGGRALRRLQPHPFADLLSSSGHNSFLTTPDDQGERLDLVVARYGDLSRSRATRLIREGHVRVDGETVTRNSTLVQAGQQLVISAPFGTLQPEAALPGTPSPALSASSAPELRAKELPLDIVHEDSELIVLFKPAGLVVHPGPGHPDGTLVNALLHHCGPSLLQAGDPARPGIVHRLDRETSGLMVVATTANAAEFLRAQFNQRSVHRTYLALCVHTSAPALLEQGRFETLHGRHPVDRRRFTGHQGPRDAITDYQVLERFEEGALLVRCQLFTGRTHQIRVHLSESGHPILGDSLYGGRAVGANRWIQRPALHATSLGFQHPDGRELYFEAPPPEDFNQVLHKLHEGMSWRR